MNTELDEITKIEIVLNIINLLSVKAKYFSKNDIFFELTKIKNNIYYDYNFFDYEKLLLGLIKINKKFELYEK